MSDSSELSSIISKILDDNSEEVQRLKDGDKKLTGFFMGQIMRATKGKANHKDAQALLQEEIAKR